MPHFIIDCSEAIVYAHAIDDTIKTVHDTAEATGLFKQGDIKVRLQTFKHYVAGGTKRDFIHVFGYIMEGRTTEQKADLSKRIITVLKQLFPEVPVISMNVYDFEKATYCNRNLIP